MIQSHMFYTSVQQFLLSALGYGLTAVSDFFPLEDYIRKLPPLCLKENFLWVVWSGLLSALEC